MPNPSIPLFNGQIKTPWRGGYTSVDQLAENSRECGAQMDGCAFNLIWKTQSLMSFQFVRPFTMSLVSTWELYNADGTIYRDLTPEISKLGYFATNLVSGAAVQYVYYLGTPLNEVLDPGVYYMRIVSGGITYYWEPLLIVCDSFGPNVLPDFTDGLFADDNTDAPWYVGTWSKILARLKVSAGAPVEDGTFVGEQVGNIGDDDLYTWNGSTWDSSLVGPSEGWYDLSTGNWYLWNSGWFGDPSPPLVLNGDGACWNGDADAPLAISLDGFGCTGGNVRVTVTVTGMTTGTLTVAVPDTAASVAITEDGTYDITSLNEAGYTIELTPSGGFDGCVTSALMECALDAADCFYRLDWSNCGNIGNTYLAGGYTNSMYFERAVYPVRPRPEITIESKQRADGSVVTTSRRRETTWEIEVGLVPWYVADALAELSLYDHVELRLIGGGADVLMNVAAAVEWTDGFGECLASVTITFQIDASAVACCDDFAPPCKTTCVDAEGYDDTDPLVDGQVYLFAATSAYGVASGGGMGELVACASGLANITDHGDFVRTVYFDLNTGAWSDLAIIDTVTSTPVDDGCTLNILAIIPTGYSAVLQYFDVDGDWITDETYDLPWTEWVANDIQRVTPEDEDPVKGLRLMVYVDGIGADGKAFSGRCIVGYSAEFTYCV